MTEKKLVRVLVEGGSDGPEFKMVPFSEVPPGHIFMKLADFGFCFTDPKGLEVNDKPLHPEFPEGVRDSLRRVMNALISVQPMTLEEWEFGFRCDIHPWAEIALYERMAEAFEEFTSHIVGDDQLSEQKKRDVFDFILGLTTTGPCPPGYDLRPPATMTRKRVQQVHDWFFSDSGDKQRLERANTLRDQIMPDRLAGPDRVHIHALFGEGNEINASSRFSPMELIASADVILGVVTDSAQEFTVFGRAVGRSLVGGDSPSRRLLRVELDRDTDDLARLLALVSAVKGRHDYPTS